MSVEATLATWKLSKKLVTATEKLFLLSCANRAGENHECWPSLQRLCNDTGLNRKTIIKVRQSVIDKNLLQYSGQMVGRSGQIPVMRLTYVEDLEAALTSPKIGTRTSTKNGTGDQYQKRDTESKRTESKKRTTNCKSSSSFIFSKTLDEKMLDQKLDRDTRTDEEFLKEVENHVENHSDKKYNKAIRQNAAVKLLANLKEQNVIFYAKGNTPNDEAKPKPQEPSPDDLMGIFTRRQWALIDEYNSAMQYHKVDPTRIDLFLTKEKQQEARELVAILEKNNSFKK